MHTGLYIAFFQTRSVSMATIEAVKRWKCRKKRWVGGGWSGDIGGKRDLLKGDMDVTQKGQETQNQLGSLKLSN